MSDLKEFDIQYGALIKYNGAGGDVVVPDGVKSIERKAFESCEALMSITLPNTVTVISVSAFQGCEKLNSVIMQNGLDSIGENAFNSCRSLKDITFPESLKYIRASAFQGCESLESIILPDSLKVVGSEAFKNCSQLRIVKLPNYCPYNNCTFGTDAFDGCKCLFIRNDALIGYEGSYVDLVVPDGVTSIGRSAFDNCRNLTSIVLPESLESIGEYAFQCCVSLKDVTLPKGLKTIGNFAYATCSNLASVTLPKELESVGFEVFWRCRSLTNVVLPEGLKVIGEEMFSECSALKNVEIPGSVTSFGAGAFEKCESLTSVILHAGLKTVGKNAFKGGKSLTEVVLPEGLETIENGAFQGCRSLTAIAIPESVKRIGKGAFGGCKNLTHITLPKGLETIGTDVFKGCDKLGDVEIPAGATVSDKRPPRFSVGALHKQICERIPPQPAVKLAVKRGKVGLFDSKLGGTPYFPRDMEFPRGRANGFEGQPLTLLAQLNFDTLPHIPDFPTKGILQFFIAKDGRFGVGGYHGEELTDQANFRVIYHENVVTDETKLLSADEIPQYVGNEDNNLLPVKGEYRLVAKKPADMAVTSSDHRFEKEILRICEEVYGKKLENVFELDDAFDCEDLGERLFEKADGYEGTFIGGYPCLIQDDPRESDCADCDTLLLEIWDQDDPEICWGFPGTGSFFIPRENLKALDFSRVLYNVDCD